MKIFKSCELSVNLVRNLIDLRFICKHVIPLGIFGIMLFMKMNLKLYLA